MDSLVQKIIESLPTNEKKGITFKEWSKKNKGAHKFKILRVLSILKNNLKIESISCGKSLKFRLAKGVDSENAKLVF